jgi:hypothetical protein
MIDQHAVIGPMGLGGNSSSMMMMMMMMSVVSIHAMVGVTSTAATSAAARGESTPGHDTGHPTADAAGSRQDHTFAAIPLVDCGTWSLSTMGEGSGKTCVVRAHVGLRTVISLAPQHRFVVRGVTITFNGTNAEEWAAATRAHFGLSFGFEAGDTRYVQLHDATDATSAAQTPVYTAFTSPSMPTNAVVVVVEPVVGSASSPAGPQVLLSLQLHGTAAPPRDWMCSLKTAMVGPEWSLHGRKRTDKCSAILTADVGIRKTRQLRCVMGGVHQFLSARNIRYSVDSGTLLGYIRAGDFIAWDDDIDIRVDDNDWARFQDALLALPQSIGKHGRLFSDHNTTLVEVPQLLFSEYWVSHANADDTVRATELSSKAYPTFASHNSNNIPQAPRSGPLSFYKAFCPGLEFITDECPRGGEIEEGRLLHMDIVRGSFKDGAWISVQDTLLSHPLVALPIGTFDGLSISHLSLLLSQTVRTATF